MKNSKKNLIQVVVIASVIFLFAGKSFASEITPENIIIDVNIERAIYNIQLLNVNDQLTVAAENKSADMLSRSYFEHYAFGLSPWAFIISKNYQYQSAGENLARGFKTSEGVVNAWMNSPAHRANILNPNFEDIGVGVVKGAYVENGKANQTILTTELLAEPESTPNHIFKNIIQKITSIFK